LRKIGVINTNGYLARVIISVGVKEGILPLGIEDLMISEISLSLAFLRAGSCQ
jgi:hypothetical protein